MYRATWKLQRVMVLPNEDKLQIVRLIEERCYAFLISRGAYVSLITRTGQLDDAEYVDNDDYEEWERYSIEYESDDDEPELDQ